MPWLALSGRHATMMPWRRVSQLAWLVLVSALAMGTLPTPAPAAAAGWSPPVKVSGTTIGAWFPDIAVDLEGRPHVVWNGVAPEGSRFEVGSLFYARGEGEAWSQPNDIALIWKGHALRSSIVADATGRLHLIYKGLGQQGLESLLRPGSLGQEDLWYTSANGANADIAGAWAAAKKITGGAVGYFSDITIDSRGMLHVIFTETGEGRWGLYYRRSADGGVTWSRRVALDDSQFVWWYRAHLKVDSWDRLHVVWEVTDREYLGLTLGAAHALSADGGDTWSIARFQRLSPNPSSNGQPDALLPGPQQPSIGVDGWGGMLFVFRDPDSQRILYQLSHDGAEWSQAQPLPGISKGIARPYDVYDMLTDSAGHVHLVLVGYPAKSEWLSLLHSVWDGRGWSAPTVVTAAPPEPDYGPAFTPSAARVETRPLLSPPYPEYPRLALSGGNRLHLVWFGGDRLTVDREPIGVWYSTLVTGAPELNRPTAAVASTAQPPRRATPSAVSRLPTPAPVPLPPAPRSVTANDGEQMVDYRRWQEQPLVVSGAVLLPLLVAVLLARLQSVTRPGRQRRGRD